MSGTPFKDYMGQIHKYESEKFNSFLTHDYPSLYRILDYLTMDVNFLKSINILDIDNYNYILNHFSRNKHCDNLALLKLPEINEEIVMLNFSQTERMLYNSYLSDNNNKQDDIFLRHLCCHPSISEEILKTNEMLSLEDMQKHIQTKYLNDYEILIEQQNKLKLIIVNETNNINDLTKEYNEQYIIVNNTHVNNTEKNKNEINLKISNKKTKINKLNDDLLLLNDKITNKNKSINYYKSFIEIIKNKNVLENEMCNICLNNIDELNLGITNCYHLFCYDCICQVIKSSKTLGTASNCPTCKTKISSNNIYLINKTMKEEVNKYGTKIEYIINYIKKSKNKYRIIFSQWSRLLINVGKILEENGIKILYCSGGAYQKNNVLKLFNNDDDSNEYRILMLSSEKTASGTNLSNAEEVIFLDPIYGNKQHRLNTENQAIGRVRRLGNKHSQIKVLRLLIKDSVEEEIFKSNQEDK